MLVLLIEQTLHSDVVIYGERSRKKNKQDNHGRKIILIKGKQENAYIHLP